MSVFYSQIDNGDENALLKSSSDIADAHQRIYDLEAETKAAKRQSYDLQEALKAMQVGLSWLTILHRGNFWKLQISYTFSSWLVQLIIQENGLDFETQTASQEALLTVEAECDLLRQSEAEAKNELDLSRAATLRAEQSISELTEEVAEIPNLRTEVERLIKELDEAQQRYEELQRAADRFAAVEEQNEEFKAKIEEVEEHYNALEEAITALKQQLEGKEQQLSQLEQQHSEIMDEKEQVLKAIMEEKDKVEERLQQKDIEQQKVKEMEEDITRLKKTVEEFENKKGKAEEEGNTIAVVAAERDELQDSLAVCERRCQEGRLSSQAKDDEAKQLHLVINRLREEHKELSRQLNVVLGEEVVKNAESESRGPSEEEGTEEELEAMISEVRHEEPKLKGRDSDVVVLSNESAGLTRAHTCQEMSFR